MNDEWFSKLKEFDSLTNMKSRLLEQIHEQNKRLDILNLKRQEKEQGINAAIKELHEIQQTYHETEKKLNTSEQQANRLKDTGAADEKIQAYIDEAQKCETQMFEFLEKIENQEKEIEESRIFLKGLEKTYQEIKLEADTEIATHQNEVTQLNKRLDLIREELPLDFKTALEKTLQKKLAIGPFTRTDQSHCYFCRYKISRTEESEIDVQKILKHCPQCSRIFLPYGC